MNRKELKDWIIDNCITSNGKISSYSKIILEKNNFLKILIEETKILGNDIPIGIRVKYLLLDFKSFPKCIECNKKLKLNRVCDLEKKFCSYKCLSNSKITKNKKETTNLKKYGFTNPNKSSKVKNKIKDTNLKRYGVEYTFEFKEIQDKIKKTNLERYKVEIPSKSEKIKKKIENTNLEKYGVKNVFESKEVKDKIKLSNKDKYGVENFNQKHLSQYCIEKSKDLEWLVNKNKEKTLVQIANDLGCSPSVLSKTFTSNQLEAKRHQYSIGEKEVLEFIKSIYNGEVLENTRAIIPPLELDIFLPELNIAIEYNGEYWHNILEENNPGYHKNKLNRCLDLGINLIEIWDYEWENNQQLVKEKIKNLVL